MQVRTFCPAMYDKDSALRAIIDGLGIEFFLRVQERLGGLDVTVPQQQTRLTQGHQLVQALWAEDAAALCRVIGGEQVYIPRGYVCTKLGAVEREVKAGTSNPAIAAKLGVSTRHVRRLKQRLAELLTHPGAIIAAE